MADEPKSDSPSTPTPEPGATSVSPAPLDVVETKPGDKPAAADAAAAPAASDASSRVIAEPLSDGTVPTVINAGESHHSVPKGPASITKIYHKADILTTLFTFVGMLVALSIIGGLYYYFTSKNKPAAPANKVTTLDKAELQKLGSFFEGNSAGGTGSEVLTITSSTLFKGRVAASSDLKVIGGVEVGGPTSLGDLRVDKTSTLGVTNIRGQLGVDGPTNFRGPALLGAGASVNGNFTVSGTGSFGGAVSAGSLNVANVSVTGTLNLAGHLSMSGQNPSATPGSEAGSGATASAEGNDAAGSVTVNSGTVTNQINNPGGLLVTLNFRTTYPRAPHVVITSVGQNGAKLVPYVLITATGFTIGVVNDASSQQSYTFDYWVVQ